MQERNNNNCTTKTTIATPANIRRNIKQKEKIFTLPIKKTSAKLVRSPKKNVRKFIPENMNNEIR